MIFHCPNCGKFAAFVVRQGAGKDPDTGYVDGEYLECLECGSQTEASEVDLGLNAKCSDCPPEGYPTDKTRCVSCPLRNPFGGYQNDPVLG